MYKIGQLAKEAGISIRTLRYYDEQGILTPSYVSEAGYRYYNQEDIMKLHHIATLKQLGFTLEQIRGVVEAESGRTRAEQWSRAIHKQLELLREEKHRLELLERKLLTTLRTIELRDEVTAEELLLFIHSLQSRESDSAAQSVRRENRAKRFASDELPIIETLPKLDEDDPRADEWIELLRDIRSRVGEPPDSPVSRRLAERILTIGEQWFQGRDDVLKKYWDWVRPEPGEDEKVLGLDEETMAYIDRIVDEYLRREQAEPSEHSDKEKGRERIERTSDGG
ncbi:MerR family transcriptional regulator [Cohnella xylanilytica]|uniref:MerR family transcriptional regulator n=1 Tax=Cohnella xylanilytica TaxID=557555 RepID=UPI001B13702C|nr:MerR family transcriptional regulator [Cohnella xylanilytica]GIO15157.1 MerR family transcriptional regulator [Cohnella xylanilytica]